MTGRVTSRYALLFVALLAIYSSSRSVNASTSYYKEKFTDWGLQVDLFDTSSLGVLKNPKRDYLMLTSSSFAQYQQNLGVDKHTKIVLIIDEDFSLEGKLVCTKFYCDSKENYSISLDKTYFGHTAQVAFTKISDKWVLAIPEHYLLIPEISRNLELLITSIPSDSGTNNVDDKNSDTQVLFLRDFALSTFGGLFFGLPVVLVIFTFLFHFSRYTKNIDPGNTTIKCFNKLAKDIWILLNRAKYRLLFIFMLMTVPNITGFMYLFNKTLSVTEAVKIILPFISNFSLTPPISRASFVSDILLTFIVTYLVLWIILCVLYASPFIKSLSLVKLLNTLKKSVLEKLYTVFLVLLILLSLVIDIKSFVTPFFCLLLILIILTFYLRGSETILGKNASLKHRAAFMILVLLATIAGYWTRPFVLNITKLNRISLADLSKKYLALPISLPIDSQTEFNDLHISTSNSILVNEFMVVSPYNDKVINESITAFHSVDNFLVLSPDKKVYIDVLPKLKSILHMFKTSSLTSYFSIDDKDASEISMILTFDCSRGLQSKTITLNSYSLDSVSPYKNAISKKILNFPGCNKSAGYPLTEYQVPLPKAFQPGNNFIFELVDREKERVIDYKLQGTSGPLAITNYKDPEKSKVLFDSTSKEMSKEPVTVFSFSDIPRKEFNRTGTFVNLAEIINGMIKEHVIKGSLRIWSLENFTTIKLDGATD